MTDTDPAADLPRAGVTGLADTLLSAPLLDLLGAGGPVVAILLVLSVAALAIVLVKLWQFRAARLGDRATVRTAVALHRRGRSGEALALAQRSRNPVAQVAACAIFGSRSGDLPQQSVREEVGRLAAVQLEMLRSYLRPLEVIAAVAPLLGLFGTVLGMIEAFRRMEQAGARVDPSVLSGGIWEALLTTAVGLAVAIPAVAALAWLERVVDRVTHDMETIVTQVFTPDLSIVEPDMERHHDLSRLRQAGLMADR